MVRSQVSMQKPDDRAVLSPLKCSSVNEHSARYSILPNEFYSPEIASLAEQSTSNKQGRSETSVSVPRAREVRHRLETSANRAFNEYEHLLNATPEGQKVDQLRPQLARELARIGLPLSTYTEWYWKIDLHNLLNFLRLRMDGHAQFEIRSYAETIGDIVRGWVPVVYQAFEDYTLRSVHLSEEAAGVLRTWLAGQTINREDTGLSKTEWNDLVQRFAPSRSGRSEK